MKRYTQAEYGGVTEDEFGPLCHFAEADSEISRLKSALNWLINSGAISVSLDCTFVYGASGDQDIPTEFITLIAEATK